MSSRRRLKHYSEQELEELLHAPATSGLRNVLSFGRTSSDVSSPGDVSTPGGVSSSGHNLAPRSGGLAPVRLSDLPVPPLLETEKRIEAPPDDVLSPGDITSSDVTPTVSAIASDDSTPGDVLSPGDVPTSSRTPFRLSRQRILPIPELIYRTADGIAVEPKRVQRATLVQHGHSPTEQLVYQILYNAGVPDSSHPAWRDVQIGYDRLARQTGITKRNIIPLMHRLEKKLSIDVAEYQDSTRNLARKYRVFNMTEVLERRRKAHMEFVIRHRGVEFVFAAGPGDVSSPGDIASSGTPASPGDVPTPAPGDVSTPAPGDKTSPLLGSSFRKKLGTSSTGVPAPPVIATAIINEFGFLDDAALRH